MRGEETKAGSLLEERGGGGGGGVPAACRGNRGGRPDCSRPGTSQRTCSVCLVGGRHPAAVPPEVASDVGGGGGGGGGG